MLSVFELLISYLLGGGGLALNGKLKKGQTNSKGEKQLKKTQKLKKKKRENNFGFLC